MEPGWGNALPADDVQLGTAGSRGLAETGIRGTAQAAPPTAGAPRG